MKDSEHARVLELHQTVDILPQDLTDDLLALRLVQLVGQLLLKYEHGSRLQRSTQIFKKQHI